MDILDPRTLPLGTNYVEIYITSNTNCLLDGRLVVHDVNLDKENFYQVLTNMKMYKNDVKVFQKEYKEYVISDVVSQVYPQNDEVKVYKKKCFSIETINKYPNTRMVCSNRNKLTLLNFPSTKNIQDSTYVKTLIFRISNRIFVNFCVTTKESAQEKFTYTVYINYNHEDSVDTTLVNTTLDELITTLTQVPTY